MSSASGPSKKGTTSATPLLRGRVTRATTIVNKCKVPDATPWIPPGFEFLFTAPLKPQQTPVPHPVLAYIMGEMKKNAASPFITGLRFANDLVATSESSRKRSAELPWAVFIGARPSSALVELLLEASALGMFGAAEAPASYSVDIDLPFVKGKLTISFRDWVRNYVGISAWDYKPNIHKNGFGYRQDIDFSPIGKHETITIYYDVWSNIHFGYVGRAAGFPEERLFWGSDVASIVTLGTKDEKADKVATQIGIDLYNEGGDLTLDRLLRKVYEKRDVLTDR